MLLLITYSFSPRTLNDAIKEDKLLTMNQFQYVKRDSEGEYEEYVKGHQQAYLERFYQKHSNETWFQERFGTDAKRTHSTRLSELDLSTCLDYEESLGWKVQEMDRKSRETTFRICNENHPSFVWPESMRGAVIGIKGQEKAIQYIESSKQSLEELRREHQGEVIVGKPRQHAEFSRSVWIYKDVGGGTTNYQPNNIIRCISSHWNTQVRIEVDLDFARKLVKALEPDMEFETEGEDKKRALDQLIIYLRQAHSTCYYCATQCDCHEELLQVCGPVHLRETLSNPEDVIDMEWFDRKILRLIDAFSLHLPPLSLDYFLEKYQVTGLDPTKFGCRHCNKLFKGADYVVKHMHLKHADVVQGECSAALALLNNLLANPGDCVLPATILPHHPNTSYNTNKRRGSLDRRGGSSKRLAMRHHDGSSEIKRPLRRYIDLDAPPTTNDVIDINYDEEAP